MLEDTFSLDAIDEADSPLPWPVAEFLRTADGRIRDYLHDRHGHGAGFVPSDFPLVYRALEDEMGSEIHALSLRTYTPERWAASAE